MDEAVLLVVPDATVLCFEAVKRGADGVAGNQAVWQMWDR
jgi:hypothetical protein